MSGERPDLAEMALRIIGQHESSQAILRDSDVSVTGDDMARLMMAVRYAFDMDGDLLEQMVEDDKFGFFVTVLPTVALVIGAELKPQAGIAALDAAARALAEASEALDAEGCQVAASQAHQAHHAAREAAEKLRRKPRPAPRRGPRTLMPVPGDRGRLAKARRRGRPR